MFFIYYWQVLYFCFDFLKHITSDEYSIGSTQSTVTIATDTPNPHSISTSVKDNRTDSSQLTTAASNRHMMSQPEEGLQVDSADSLHDIDSPKRYTEFVYTSTCFKLFLN